MVTFEFGWDYDEKSGWNSSKLHKIIESEAKHLKLIRSSSNSAFDTFKAQDGMVYEFSVVAETNAIADYTYYK